MAKGVVVVEGIPVEVFVLVFILVFGVAVTVIAVAVVDLVLDKREVSLASVDISLF